MGDSCMQSATISSGCLLHSLLLSDHKNRARPMLGIELGKRRGAYTSFAARLAQAARCRACELLHCGCAMNELAASCSARLWTTMVRPMLEYGAEVWRPTLTQADAFERLQAQLCRRVLGCSRSVPRAFAISELGLRS